LHKKEINWGQEREKGKRRQVVGLEKKKQKSREEVGGSDVI
jgi:hypothetical protein